MGGINVAQQELKRDLKNRHVQLIAIGGTIGTGLFLGSGKAIQLAGPSIIFAYLIVGIALFFVMRALGELLLSNAGYQSFTDFAVDYIGPWAGYVTGWTYWFCWIMTAMADIIAVGVYVRYWFDIPQWVPALVVLVILLGLNLLTVKLFGELEFWFALIKVITILALIVIGSYFANHWIPNRFGNCFCQKSMGIWRSISTWDIWLLTFISNGCICICRC